MLGNVNINRRTRKSVDDIMWRSKCIAIVFVIVFINSCSTSERSCDDDCENDRAEAENVVQPTSCSEQMHSQCAWSCYYAAQECTDSCHDNEDFDENCLARCTTENCKCYEYTCKISRWCWSAQCSLE